jgi:hypothetical protein
MGIMIAPWLRVPDYLSAMRSATSLGINLREQDLAEQETARLGMGSPLHI